MIEFLCDCEIFNIPRLEIDITRKFEQNCKNIRGGKEQYNKYILLNIRRNPLIQS